jgi:hypothetical protein
VIYTQYQPHYSPAFHQFRRFSLAIYKKYQATHIRVQPLYHGKSRHLAFGNIRATAKFRVVSDSQYVRVEKGHYFHQVIYRYKQITGIILLHGN